jgi:hypothetical protein
MLELIAQLGRRSKVRQVLLFILLALQFKVLVRKVICVLKVLMLLFRVLQAFTIHKLAKLHAFLVKAATTAMNTE